MFTFITEIVTEANMIWIINVMKVKGKLRDKEATVKNDWSMVELELRYRNAFHYYYL